MAQFLGINDFITREKLKWPTEMFLLKLRSRFCSKIIKHPLSHKTVIKPNCEHYQWNVSSPYLFPCVCVRVCVCVAGARITTPYLAFFFSQRSTEVGSSSHWLRIGNNIFSFLYNCHCCLLAVQVSRVENPDTTTSIIHTDIHTYKQTDRQAGRQADRSNERTNAFNYNR